VSESVEIDDEKAQGKSVMASEGKGKH